MPVFAPAAAGPHGTAITQVVRRSRWVRSIRAPRRPPMSSRRSVLIHVAAAIALVAGVLVAVPASGRTAGGPGQANATTTPVQHVVVIYQENHSFDNYFGTYPNAANPPGEPVFHADAGTPTVNGLSDELLTDNPNLANPQRLDRSQEITCDNNHGYVPMQRAYD